MKERASQAFSQAFNIEHEGRSTDGMLHDDIVSYLGEYRLRVPKYSYTLAFGGQSFDDLHVRNSYNAEPVFMSALRAIEERKKMGLPTHREEAELFALNFLSAQLRSSKDGDTVVWASPPGPKDEGYGDYGFLFVGKYKKQYLGIGDLEMTAIRIERPRLVQYNAALSDTTQALVSFANGDEMLSSPFVVSGTIEGWEVDSILRKNFNFTANHEDQLMFDRVIKDMEPSIQEFMSLVKTGTREEKLKAFQTLEKYALGLADQYKNRKRAYQADGIVYLSEYQQQIPLAQLVHLYQDKELPRVSGSCGVSAVDTKSSNPLNRFENLMKAIFGNSIGKKDDEDDGSYDFNKYGDCVVCSQKAMVGPCDICQSCDSYLRAKSNSKVA